MQLLGSSFPPQYAFSSTADLPHSAVGTDYLHCHFASNEIDSICPES